MLCVAANLPGAPRQLRLVSVNRTSITVSWSPPLANQNAQGVRFVLFYGSQGRTQYTYIQVRETEEAVIQWVVRQTHFDNFPMYQ